jgi:hypothetical protein
MHAQISVDRSSISRRQQRGQGARGLFRCAEMARVANPQAEWWISLVVEDHGFMVDGDEREGAGTTKVKRIIVNSRREQCSFDVRNVTERDGGSWHWQRSPLPPVPGDESAGELATYANHHAGVTSGRRVLRATLFSCPSAPTAPH